jgi:hypothetical protein
LDRALRAIADGLRFDQAGVFAIGPGFMDACSMTEDHIPPVFFATTFTGVPSSA